MDGMDRIARAILDGRTSIEAARCAVDPERAFKDCSPRDLRHA
jgi:hypothetical protein